VPFWHRAEEVNELGTVPWLEAVLFPVGVALFPVALAALMDRIVRWLTGSPLAGRSPFTVDLARAPGFSVQGLVDKLQADFAVTIAMSVATPLGIVAMWSMHKRLGVGADDLHVAMVLSLIGGAATLWFLLRAITTSFRLRKSRFGHDLPGEGFNVDHVIVAPAGVFCVETETRAKPHQGRSVEDATAIYDGHSIRFPGIVHDQSVRHARERARWLSHWIKKATGLLVPVQPAVALPRWVIDRQGSGDVTVMNPREASRLLSGPRILEDDQIDQIAFQLEKLGRGRLEPANYRASKEEAAARLEAAPRRRRSRA
jgi:hypothetical protein